MIFWVRHGQSTWNAIDRMQGHELSPPLTDLGRAQSAQAADALVGQGVVHLLKLTRDPGTRDGCRHRRAARARRRHRAAAAGEGTDEDVAQVSARVQKILGADLPDQDTVAVSHGDTIALAVGLLTGTPPELPANGPDHPCPRRSAMNVTMPNGVTTPELRQILREAGRNGPVARRRRDPRSARPERRHPAPDRPPGRARIPRRGGGPVRRRCARCLRRTFANLLSGTGPAFGDIEAARQYVAAHADSTGKVGVIGFCMGGGFASCSRLVASTHRHPTTARCRRMPPTSSPAHVPSSDSDGGSDRTMRNAASKLDTALTTADVVHDVKEYPGPGTPS